MNTLREEREYEGENRDFNTKEEAINFFNTMKSLHPDCIIKARTTWVGRKEGKRYSVFCIPQNDERLTLPMFKNDTHDDIYFED